MKKEYFMLAAVIAVLCAYLVLHKENKTNYTTPDVPVVKIKDIKEIKIVKGKKNVSLKKEDGNWFVTDKQYPADKTKVMAMLNIIAKLSLSDLISQSNDTTRYELDSEHRIGIIAKNDSGSILRKFNVGKTAPTYRHTFVTMGNDNDVYYANGNFRSDFDHDIDGFRDKTIFSFKEDAINDIKIEKGKNKKEFFIKEENVPESKNSTGKLMQKSNEMKKKLHETKEKLKDRKINTPEVKKWVSKGDSLFSVRDIKDLVSELADFKCARYTDNDSKDVYQVKTPLCVIHIKKKNHIENKGDMVIFIYPKNKNGNYPGICSEIRYPFILGSYEGNNILSRVNALLGIKEAGEKK